MTSTLDMTDVTLVSPVQLARAMRVMIESGRGLVLLRGVSGQDMRLLETDVWDSLDGTIAQRRAVLVRLQCLAEVFATRRLRDLLLRRGFPLIAVALQVAAGMRLNAHWGFSSHKFNLAVRALEGEVRTPPHTAPDTLDLAA